MHTKERKTEIKTYNLCILGFGNVGRALARHLLAKREDLRNEYGIEWRVTGVATRRMGWIADPQGIDLEALLAGNVPPTQTEPRDVQEWLQAAQADVLFELTSTNPQTGQPAIDYMRTALELGAHVVTANKGPVVHAYVELEELAQRKGKHFLFEATVMAGAPIFSLYQNSLPATKLMRFRGLLNATSNVIINEMEQGKNFAEAVKRAQELGIAETDPSLDVDGWDATVKLCAIANVLMDVPLKLEEVQREGIRELQPAELQRARAAGTPYKQVATLERVGQDVVARVQTEQVEAGDPLAAVSPASMLAHMEMDIVPGGLTVTLHLPEDETAGPDATAYDVMADFIRAVSA
ncbi:homoserine dehydrogenase [Ktedonobacter sp. SOSP1-85]|uniref:hypothetical protein n=1 Tax=Ktedonobacter sp. SOSP1-85 TaxID=2778367 RepID=UPI0019158828|nr:hypothetical protein [Ktedonobacter sp. SOSP1-85]GHO73638.1 homoserine dehydrogenase [Ktedonobacter sp. SOSP1-85]